MSAPELLVHAVPCACACVRDCVRVLEMAVGVIIRVILKLETVLELGMSFKGGIPPVLLTTVTSN